VSITPIGGSTRFRKHQVGAQTVLGTAVAATEVVPFSGDIDVNPNLTLPDVDVGSIDPLLPPFAAALDITGSWTGPLPYNNLTDIFSYGLKGGVTPTGGGAAKTWTYQAASLSADSFDVFTDEYGDDTASSIIKAYGGLLNTWTIQFPPDLGAWTVDTGNVYAGATLGSSFTGSLTADTNPTWVYGADTQVYVDTTPGAIGTTEWSPSVAGVHNASIACNNNLDLKRFASGSNTRFVLAGYGRGPREITATITTAKTTATVAEAVTIDDGPPALRYLEFRVTSPTIITGTTPYSLSVRLPARLQSVAQGEINTNTAYTFTYRATYDSTLTYAIRAVTVNSRATL
jgi:hypothetical protein